MLFRPLLYSLIRLLPWLLLLIGLEHIGVHAISRSDMKRVQFMARLGLLPDGTPRDPLRRNSQGVNSTIKAIDPEYVSLPIDHSGGIQGTYQNRFWASMANYKPGGPVIVFDAGEGDASSAASYYLQEPDSFFGQMLKQFNGIGIVWEHRYYGGSTPYNVSLDTPAEQFKYLTIEQALADVPAFAWQFTRPNLSNVDLTPAGTPWIFVGGSYPGVRAAFVRKLYPETIFASYAASAPVEASINMSFYWDPVSEGLNAEGWGNCTNDIKAAIQEIDAIQDRGDANEIKGLYEQFLGPAGANYTKEAFADALSEVFGYWQSDGVEGQDNTSLRVLCDTISVDPETNEPSGASGWAPVKGVNFTLSRWGSWTAAVDLAGQGYPDLRYTEPDGISWTWQYCTQFGFLQAANVGPHQLISKYNSISHQEQACQLQFPDGASSGLLPELPNANATNALFGGWGIRPSNVFFTAGEFDPWRTLSPLSAESFSPQFTPSQQIPQCGNSSSSASNTNELFGYVMKDAKHCSEFDTSFAAGAPARQLFSEALTEWLKCWTPSQRPQGGSLLMHI